MARFMVNYTFQGRASELIEADSLEEAESLVEAKVDKDDFEIDADELDDVNFDVFEMHPVTRDGKEIWTTYVKSSDKRGHQSELDSSPLFAAGGGA